ncbi:RAD51-associated protein 1-like isoform X2 [Scyliorhinus canicula]|uniref:RAD51-associated protein 1-like isoform X2 n=1 Tax=Scyliorhinus canicula TaxID=7830 RepID=UPI0018F3BB74|nr:RAD51-associated protein 1-like isoform X2 [Scyliorhinus canicula]
MSRMARPVRSVNVTGGLGNVVSCQGVGWVSGGYSLCCYGAVWDAAGVRLRSSHRTKKAVDYSQSGDFDDDEDFTCGSAPPCKKSRLMTKEQKEKNIKNSGSQDANAKKELPKERLPLDEKLYQRNLEAALVQSVQEPTTEGSDMISAETKGPSVRPRQRRAAAGAASKQKQILLDERGSDGECEEDSAGEKDYSATEESENSESNTDEDEEFSFKNLSNENKKMDKVKTQMKKKEKKSPKPNNSATAPKESSNNSQERTSVRSPCQGLRLGLSRLARVKPLHPSTGND